MPACHCTAPAGLRDAATKAVLAKEITRVHNAVRIHNAVMQSLRVIHADGSGFAGPVGGDDTGGVARSRIAHRSSWPGLTRPSTFTFTHRK